mgnify:CR=1 FL=1
MFEFFRTPGNIRYSLLSITALIAFIGATDLWRKKLKKRPYNPEINFPITEKNRVKGKQTTNFGGGAIWPLESLQKICDLASQHGVKTHMDGARLLNAVAETGFVDGCWDDRIVQHDDL